MLGGPIFVTGELDYPFLVPELASVKAQLDARKPLLGLCLGSQLMARALGCGVYSMGHTEVGWSPLSATEHALEHPLRHLLAPGLSVLHFHGETFDLPPGARLLASTSLCKNQAFALERHALALQFHPEVTAAQLESWWVGHTGELRALGSSIPDLRAQSYENALLLLQPLRAFFGEWLNGL